MEHLWIPQREAQGTLVLFHGTGGDERSLLPVAEDLASRWNVLAVRGDVNERGALRFFKRFAEGQLDEEDLIERTARFRTTLHTFATTYAFDVRDVMFVGYSNGANFAANYVLQYANDVNGAILFHPMVPTRRHPHASLSSTRLFIGAGAADPLVPLTETNALATLFHERGARVHVHIERHGHQLSKTEVAEAKRWLSRSY